MWWLFLALGLMLGVMIYGRIALILVNRVRDRHPDTAAYIPILWSGYREDAELHEAQRLTSPKPELDGYWLRLWQSASADKLYSTPLNSCSEMPEDYVNIRQRIVPIINFAGKKY